MKTLIFLILCQLSAVCIAEDNLVTVIIDEQIRYQTIVGFGASDAWRIQFTGAYWPEEKTEKIADLLFSQNIDPDGNPLGIGLSIWRFYLGAGTSEMGESSGIVNEWRRAECFLDADGNYDWSKHSGQQRFLRTAKERGVSKFLAFTIAPPVFWSKNGMGHSIKDDMGMNIKPAHLEDYAAYLAEVMEHFGDEGLEFNYLSPFNEPQWSWHKNSQEGTSAQNEDLYRFIKYLSAELNERKLHTQLVIGEAATIRHLTDTVDNDSRDNQVEVFFNPSSAMYIGDLPNISNTISGHSYFTVWPIEDQVETRQKLAAKIQQTDPDLAYWQTEYCILEKNDEIKGGRKRDLGMPTALFVARIIHNDLCIANAASWQWWTALSQFDYKDGLIHLDDGKSNGVRDPRSELNESLKYDGYVRDTKLLWALGNYSRFIRPGMIRVQAEIEGSGTLVEQSKELMVSAFKDTLSGPLVLVIVNQTTTDRQVKLKSRIMNEAASSIAEMYVTSNISNLKKSIVNLDELIIPARSISTIILDN
ncbi:MAG TPA: hypothetical protein ENI20_00165 [Bacteroides sp.]|nr:hypothetical protein [Bacteroides sp.]